MRERKMQRNGLSLCAVYARIKRDLFTSNCLQSLYPIWKGTKVCVCVWRWQSYCFPGVGLCMHIQYATVRFCTVYAVPGCLQKHRHIESPERPWDISETHLHYLIFSQEMAGYFLQLCTETRASGRFFDGKDLDNRWMSALNLIIDSDGK